jgi:hypothetical protein
MQVRDSRDIVAFLPRHATSWTKMVELARILAADGRFRPIMLVTSRSIAACAPAASLDGLEVIDVADRVVGPVEKAVADLSAPIDAAEAQRRPGKARDPHLAWMRMRQSLRSLRVWRDELGRLLGELRPSVVMVPGDRELEPVAPMLAACRRRRIPTIICASNVPNIEAVRLARAGDADFDAGPDAPWLNRWAKRFHPRQVDTSGGAPMLFSPGWRTLALDRAGMLSPNPWVQGGGLADHVLHHSRSRLDIAVQQGLDRNKAVFVGDHTIDPLYRAREERSAIRARLEKDYGLDRRRQLAVLSVPNDAEHGLCDMPTHLTRLDAWMAPLVRAQLNVVLSLHPKSLPETYRPLAERHGFVIARERLADILPVGDVFICSCSSTIYWAQLCGIPVLNMDWLPYRSHHFTAPFGILTAETPAEFEVCLERFGAGEANRGLDAHAAEIRAESLFDGKAGARICDFVSTLDGTD